MEWVLYQSSVFAPQLDPVWFYIRTVPFDLCPSKIVIKTERWVPKPITHFFFSFWWSGSIFLWARIKTVWMYHRVRLSSDARIQGSSLYTWIFIYFTTCLIMSKLRFMKLGWIGCTILLNVIRWVSKKAIIRVMLMLKARKTHYRMGSGSHSRSKMVSKQ